MTRKPNVNDTYYKLTNKSMIKAIHALMDGSLCKKGSVQIILGAIHYTAK